MIATLEHPSCLPPATALAQFTDFEARVGIVPGDHDAATGDLPDLRQILADERPVPRRGVEEVGAQTK